MNLEKESLTHFIEDDLKARNSNWSTIETLLSEQVGQGDLNVVHQILSGKAEQSDLDIANQALSERPRRSEVRENTNARPINVSEMDTQTKSLFTGGSVAVVGENAVGVENLKDESVSFAKLGNDVQKAIGLERISLSWFLGLMELGVIRTDNRTEAITENLIDISSQGISIFIVGGLGIRFWIGYYDSADNYVSCTDYITTNTKFEKQSNRKVRILCSFTDNRWMEDTSEITEYVSVFRTSDKEAGATEINKIPSYWDSHLNSKIRQITGYQTQYGVDAASFVFITDTHYSANAKNSGKLIEKIVKECDIPLILYGGDTVSGSSVAPKASVIHDILETKKWFGEVFDRVLMAEGNHDAVWGTSEHKDSMNLSDTELYNYFFRHNSLVSSRINGGDGNYFYQDNQAQKIRYIVLNSSDYPYAENADGTVVSKYNKMWVGCFRPKQIEWFANVALDVPSSEWAVIVCTHMNPYSTDNDVYNGSVVAGILQAFKDDSTYNGASDSSVLAEFRTTIQVDFTNKSGDVICWVSGHSHYDKYAQTPSNIDFKIIETMNDSLSRWDDGPIKTAGTASEQAFDVFTINKKNRSVNVTRIGAGSDRSFNY